MAGFINMGFDTGSSPNGNEIFRECPFCGAVNGTRSYLNTICLGCNAKYYPTERFWLDRGTGERIYVSKDYI